MPRRNRINSKGKCACGGCHIQFTSSTDTGCPDSSSSHNRTITCSPTSESTNSCNTSNTCGNCSGCSSGSFSSCIDCSSQGSASNFNFVNMPSPVSGLSPGPITFLFRKEINSVNLQWPTFSGVIAANGVTFLTINQSMNFLPPYTVRNCYNVVVKGVSKISFVDIDPVLSQIRFYLDPTLTVYNIGDSFTIPASII